jgi:hypothetical protein
VTFADPPFDLVRIAEVLERHGVLYVTIGGACGLLHGASEYLTKDVDVMARSDQDNRRRLASALTELGAVVDSVITADDLVGNTQWDTDAGPIDVLITATGPNDTIFMYADIQPGSIVFTLGRGQTITAASLDDVIRMKEATDRFKDHQALPELRRLRGDRHPDRARAHDPFADFDIEYGSDN